MLYLLTGYRGFESLLLRPFREIPEITFKARYPVVTIGRAMAEEEKPKQLVQMSTVIASGIAAIIAALFTSRLGVAGTLIGTALTPMLMTVASAVLNAQIEKATEKISDLPTAVRGRLSTGQRIRVPGTPSPEETPEETEPPAPSRRRDRRTPGLVERLLSIPTYLKEMAPSTRRRTLLTGAAAGLVAAVIGLAGVTGLEVASGGPLSCSLYEQCSEPTASGEETGQAGTSFAQALGGSGGTDTQNAPASGEGLPVQEDQQQDVESAPDVQQTPQPQNGQYQGVPQGGEAPGQGAPVQPPAEQTPGQEAPVQPPADGTPQGEEAPAVGDPNAAPQDGVQEEPPADPGAEQEVPAAAPPEQQQ